LKERCGDAIAEEEIRGHRFAFVDVSATHAEKRVI
jgi:hypothetical protein